MLPQADPDCIHAMPKQGCVDAGVDIRHKTQPLTGAGRRQQRTVTAVKAGEEGATRNLLFSKVSYYAQETIR